jgi:hypothetical protein
MIIAHVVDQIRQLNNCEVLRPAGIPSVGLPLPADLEEFYRLCGGATLYQGSDYSIGIVSPNDFVRANPIIVGEDGEGDISFDWFIVGKADGQYITIDLDKARLGRCYDSFWDQHAVAGSCQIVANSFESLLEQLVNGRGSYWYWLQEGFPSLGDAYDE